MGRLPLFLFDAAKGKFRVRHAYALHDALNLIPLSHAEENAHFLMRRVKGGHENGLFILYGTSVLNALRSLGHDVHLRFLALQAPCGLAGDFLEGFAEARDDGHGHGHAAAFFAAGESGHAAAFRALHAVRHVGLPSVRQIQTEGFHVLRARLCLIVTAEAAGGEAGTNQNSGQDEKTHTRLLVFRKKDSAGARLAAAGAHGPGKKRSMIWYTDPAGVRSLFTRADELTGKDFPAQAGLAFS